MWDATNHSYCQKMKGKKSPGRSTKKEKKVSPSVSDSQWVILDNLFEFLNNNWNDLLSSLAMIFKMRVFNYRSRATTGLSRLVAAPLRF